MAAIEERDAVRFYVDKTSPLSPIQLVRTPGFGGSFLPRPDAARRRPARLARRHRRAARGRRGARGVAAAGGGGGGRGARRARPREWRTYALIELAWARAARAAAARGDRRAPAARGRLLVGDGGAAAARAPGAIRFDAPAAGNRPGRHGIWQRPVERRRLRDAPLLVPWSEGGLAEAPRPHADAVVVPVPVEPSGPAADARHRRGHLRGEPGEEGPRPRARRVGRRAPARARSSSSRASTRRSGTDSGGPTRQGVRFAGMLPHDEYRALLRRARVFVCAPRREDYGIAQLEALADGCAARHDALAGPVRGAAARARSSTRGSSAGSPRGSATALDDPAPDYAARAAAAARAVPARGGRPRGSRAAAAAASLALMTPLSGQSVLITGAAHGIGAETARRLAARGARVSLVGVGDLEAVAADCPGASPSRPTSPTATRSTPPWPGRSRRSAGSTPCSPTRASPRPASCARWTRSRSSASSRST